MSPDDNVVRPNAFQRAISSSAESGGGGDGGGPSDMSVEQLKQIEGRLNTIETEQRAHLRWAMLIAIGLASVFIVGFGVMMVRIDRTEDKISRLDDRTGRVETSVAELPGRIAQNLMQLNQTLLQAISAASSQRPPAPPPPAPTSTEPSGR